MRKHSRALVALVLGSKMCIRDRMKTERKVLSRQKREEEKQRLFELKQQKRKEKHRGR